MSTQLDPVKLLATITLMDQVYSLGETARTEGGAENVRTHHANLAERQLICHAQRLQQSANQKWNGCKQTLLKHYWEVQLSGNQAEGILCSCLTSARERSQRTGPN